jgi:hypothetical protein
MGYRMARHQDTLGLVAAFGLACVATLILAPIARGHYFVLLLPAVMFTSAWLVEHGRRRWALTMAAVPTALSIAHYVALDYAGRIGLLGIGTTVWYAVACVALWRLQAAAHPPSTAVASPHYQPARQSELVPV